jgi:hypothetical protein
VRSITANAIITTPKEMAVPNMDKTAFFAISKLIVLAAAGAFAIAVAIKLSWRIVGGRATFNSILLTQFYVYSGYIIILSFMNLILAGVLAIFYPDYYSELTKVTEKGLAHMFNQQISNPEDLSAIFKKYPNLLLFQTAVSFFVDFVFLYWLIAIWGAYRELNSASRARSLAAFIICGLISVPTLGLMLLLAAGGSLTTAPH